MSVQIACSVKESSLQSPDTYLLKVERVGLGFSESAARDSRKKEPSETGRNNVSKKRDLSFGKWEAPTPESRTTPPPTPTRPPATFRHPIPAPSLKVRRSSLITGPASTKRRYLSFASFLVFLISSFFISLFFIGLLPLFLRPVLSPTKLGLFRYLFSILIVNFLFICDFNF